MIFLFCPTQQTCDSLEASKMDERQTYILQSLVLVLTDSDSLDRGDMDSLGRALS